MSRSYVAAWRNYAQSTPEGERRSVANFLNDGRNSELSHRDALAAAQVEHDRVREAAIRVFDLHALEEERAKIELEQERERERLRKERELVVEEERLRALKAQKVVRPPPPPEPQHVTPPPPRPTKPQTGASLPAPASPVSPTLQNRQSQSAAPDATAAPPAKASSAAAAPPVANGFPSTQPPRNPFGQPAATTAQPPAPSPFAQQAKPNGPTPQASTGPAAPAKPTPAVQPAAATPPPPDRYLQIHQELKKLRKQLEELAKTPGTPLKATMGDMRREIRKSMGQLTGGKGANAKPVTKIRAALRESLGGNIPSPLVDVATFVTDPREPDPEAVHNGDQFPSLFIYLMSIFAKSVINQFINECGASPKSADPIGVVAAQIFSDRDFQWRGQSMIDVLLAKLRRSCPVVFGVRGSDKTVGGRSAIGWRRDGGSWMPEQMHMDRMAGLGAGFAAISLRDFSRANKANPFPPTYYWRALAGIVNTPAAQVSDTQYVVLKAMIDGHEARFLQFYGHAALAALRVALVEFPKKAPGSAAAGGLRVLGDVLRDEKGLDLG